jgi:hypothetical protein
MLQVEGIWDERGIKHNAKKAWFVSTIVLVNMNFRQCESNANNEFCYDGGCSRTMKS